MVNELGSFEGTAEQSSAIGRARKTLGGTIEGGFPQRFSGRPDDSETTGFRPVILNRSS